MLFLLFYILPIYHWSYGFIVLTRNNEKCSEKAKFYLVARLAHIENVFRLTATTHLYGKIM